MRGKVVVANSLVISKCNYVIGAVDLPDWVLNEMKEVGEYIFVGRERG